MTKVGLADALNSVASQESLASESHETIISDPAMLLAANLGGRHRASRPGSRRRPAGDGVPLADRFQERLADPLGRLLHLLIEGLRVARRARRANGRVTFSVAAVIGRPDSRVLCVEAT
jgi:hypothetical protein